MSERCVDSPHRRVFDIPLPMHYNTLSEEVNNKKRELPLRADLSAPLHFVNSAATTQSHAST